MCRLEAPVTKTDWIFVQQAKKGDSHAFARLYEIYYKDLYHFALYYTKDSITAEDAVSSAVLKAFEQLHKLLVITLSVFGGYTSREIAGILKKREGSIRSIKSRALAKLREKNADL